VDQFEIRLPDYLPILGHGLYSPAPQPAETSPAHPVTKSKSDLAALLCKPLLMFALEFERAAPLSLAISATILRLAGNGPVAVRDLPQKAGISKEAAAAASFLEKRGHAALKTSAPRNKSLTLTPKGQKAFETYNRLVHEIEEHWQGQFGKERVQKLRA